MYGNVWKLNYSGRGGNLTWTENHNYSGWNWSKFTNTMRLKMKATRSIRCLLDIHTNTPTMKRNYGKARTPLRSIFHSFQMKSKLSTVGDGLILNLLNARHGRSWLRDARSPTERYTYVMNSRGDYVIAAISMFVCIIRLQNACVYRIQQKHSEKHNWNCNYHSKSGMCIVSVFIRW